MSLHPLTHAVYRTTSQPENSNSITHPGRFVKKTKCCNNSSRLNVSREDTKMMVLAYFIFSAALLALAVDVATEE
jgi:hypothetical protein